MNLEDNPFDPKLAGVPDFYDFGEPDDGATLEQIIDIIRSLSSRDSFVDTRYEVFYTRESREELYFIGKGITDYVARNDIGTVCFMDRSARPAYVALNAYWSKAYPGVEKPDIRFINPKGCVSLEDVRDGRIDAADLAYNDSLKQGEVEDFRHIRSGAEIVAELTKAIKKSQKSDRPILLFDACIHTGQSILSVIDKLLLAGILDIRIGAVSDQGMVVDLPLDLQVLHGRPDLVCYPFGYDTMVKKVYGSVTSEANIDRRDVRSSRLIRQEIKQAVEEQWNLEHNIRTRPSYIMHFVA